MMYIRTSIVYAGIQYIHVYAKIYSNPRTPNIHLRIPRIRGTTKPDKTKQIIQTTTNGGSTPGYIITGVGRVYYYRGRWGILLPG